MNFKVVRLRPTDVGLMRAINALFARAFDDQQSYEAAPPSDAYVRRQLDKDHVIMLAALADGEVIGGLVAYVLEKLEQERSLLERKIEELRVFERDYRTRLKSYLENLLGDLDARGASVAPRQGGGNEQLTS